jgi:hypothetical protein
LEDKRLKRIRKGDQVRVYWQVSEKYLRNPVIERFSEIIVLIVDQN